VEPPKTPLEMFLIKFLISSTIRMFADTITRVTAVANKIPKARDVE
jgi:hypothetical protein